MKNEKGLTLVELMIVTAIIGILVAITVPKFAHILALQKAKDARAAGTGVRGALPGCDRAPGGSGVTKRGAEGRRT